MRRTWLYFLMVIIITCLAWAGPVKAEEEEPDPGDDGPTAITDRLAAPVMPENPSQADLGAQVYYQVCMACHGDQGQGLTDEWREVWEEDSYCWDSKCHGPSHPPWGFQFPQVVPPVIGPGTLMRFANAQELYDYTVETMPWWNPGYLKVEEYWQVTAFLMRAHNALPEGVTLGDGNAEVFSLHSTQPIPDDSRPAALIIASLLLAIAGLLVIQHRLGR